jgi:hypothetical protein
MVAAFHNGWNLRRAAVRDRPLFGKQQTGVGGRKIHHIARTIVAHVYTIKDIRQLANEDDFHSAVNRSNGRACAIVVNAPCGTVACTVECGG